MQNRIDRLEGLVLSLMTNGSQSAGPAAAVAAISRSTSDSKGSGPMNLAMDQDNDMVKDEEEDGESDIDSVSNSFGILKVDNEKHKSMYWGDSHWHMVLADIAEVKNYFTKHKKEMETHYTAVRNQHPNSDKDGPAFLFQAHAPATELELRAGIPARNAVDKLVTRYLNSLDPAVAITHPPTLQKQLLEHWRDPSKTSIVWLALLYSILCLAMQSYYKVGDEPPEWKGRTSELAGEYRLKVVQCLVTSDYTKSVDNTIEALVLYLHGEYGTRWDAEVGIWVIVSMIVRLAMRMGYHRDPKNFPNITPFQGEMRRRIWAFVRLSDIMLSHQIALPDMIRSSSCDTQLPSNIYEDEFGPDSRELPPSRPDCEATPIAYLRLKCRIAFEFGEIVEEMNSVAAKQASYEEILRHDSNLREIKANMPPHLRLRPIEECAHDPVTLLMQRHSIDIFWNKCMCVLHRKYLSRARRNPKYSHSRRTCVESSMEILRAQSKLTKEAQPGGRLRAVRWYISALTKHDFLLAAMLVCLDLHYDSVDSQSPAQTPYDVYFWTPAQRADMLAALQESHFIWKEAAPSSVEAYKAAGVLGTMLQRLKAALTKGKTTSMALNGATAAAMDTFAGFDQNQPEHSAAMTLGMLSSGGLTPDSANMFTATTPAGVTNRFGNGKFDLLMADSSTSGSGHTPNFSNSLNPFGAPMSGLSPFSILNNLDSGGAGETVDFSENLDWEAWDSYIQNNHDMDPSLYQLGGVGGFDGGGREMQTDAGLFGNGPFMGAPNTPGGRN